MSYITKFMMISIMMLLATITVGGVYGSTVTVSGGQIAQVGNEISVPIVLDIADNGLIYYQMKIIVADPTVAQVTKVDFPSWVSLPEVVTTLPATEVVATGGDLAQIPKNQPGSINIPIATVTLKGLKAGSTLLNLNFVGEDLGGATMRPTIQAGTLQVNGVAPTTTPISVSSTPTGSSVYLDGTVRGITPLTIPTVSYGTHILLLTNSGYQDSSNTVTVSASSNTFAYTLTPIPVVTTTPITVSSTPTGSSVYLDGTVRGTTPLTIPTVYYGTHTLLLTNTGYLDSSNTVTVSASSNTFAYALTPTPVPTMPVPTGPTGQVYFSTTPQGARIFIDGALANMVTPTIMAVPVGTHQAVFKLAGYNDLQVGFTAQQSSMVTVSRRLSPGASSIPTTPPVTTVATTIPRTTGTLITTVPTTVPTIIPTPVPTTVPYYWLYQQLTVPSWFKDYWRFY